MTKRRNPFKHIVVALALMLSILLGTALGPALVRAAEAPDSSVPAGAQSNTSESLPESEAVGETGEGGVESQPEQEGEQSEEASSEEAAGDGTGSEGVQPVAGNSITVYSYAELRDALQNDNGYTTILFGQDIVQDTNTGNFKITVSPTKTSVVIDGQGFTFTQMASASGERLIVVAAGNNTTKNVALRNMTIVGGNIFGVVGSQLAVTGLEIAFENVNYSGPQPFYNRGGTIRLVDTTIELNNRGATAGEVSEAAHVVLGGTVKITKTNTADSIFWLTGSSTSLTVLPGADVDINTAHYFIYADGSRPTIEIGENASLKLVQNNGFTWDAQVVNTLTLQKNASLSVTQNGDRGFAGMYLYSKLTVNEGASFEMIRTKGTLAAIRFMQAGAVAEFNDPARVAIYSAAKLPLQFAGAGTLKISAGTLNRWQASGATPAGLENLPGYIWNKAGGALLEVSGAYNNATLQSITHNLDASDPVPEGVPLTVQNFASLNTQLLTFGRMPIAIHPVYNHSIVVGGQTLPEAAVRVEYPNELGVVQTAEGNAPGGGFALGLEGDAPVVGTALQVTAFGSSLAARQRTGVLDGAGYKLSFLELPPFLVFEGAELPAEGATIGRQDEGWKIVVEDSRVNKTPWRLDVSVVQPMTAQDGSQLMNSLVYVDGEGNRTTLGEMPTTVYNSPGGQETVDVQWQQNSGILLWLPPGAAHSNTEYTTTLQWTLYDVP